MFDRLDQESAVEECIGKVNLEAANPNLRLLGEVYERWSPVATENGRRVIGDRTGQL